MAVLSSTYFALAYLSKSSLSLRVTPSTNFPTTKREKVKFLSRNGFLSKQISEINAPFGDGFVKDENILRQKVRLLVSRAKPNFNTDVSRWDKSDSSRLLGNLALAAGLTYLTMTGRFGWLVDTFVSIFLLSFLLPLFGMCVLFWIAGTNIIQSDCSNCGLNFQIFNHWALMSTNFPVDLLLRMVCSSAHIVPNLFQSNKFERELTWFFSKRYITNEEVYNGFSTHFEEGISAAKIVDIDAEVKDIE